MNVHVCPRCGSDITPDVPILMNEFAMQGAGHPLYFNGILVPLAHAEALICWSLMKAYPRFLSFEVLADRCGAETENPAGLIRSYVSRIRSKLRDIEAPPYVIKSMPHAVHAYIWDPQA